MQNKKVRSDNTYLITQISTDNPKLGAKILSNGKESLFLDFYDGGFKSYDAKTGKEITKYGRHRESLSLYLWTAPRTTEERQQNKETLELAEKIRFERSQEILECNEGYRLKRNRHLNFYDYFQNYLDNYTKKDGRMIYMALTRFKNFIKSMPKYQHYTEFIKPEHINHEMIVDFVEYLQEHSKGEGAKSCFQRFKKVIKYAYEHDIFKKNPCDGIQIRVDDQQLRKDVLTEEEIMQLINYHDPKQNSEVRRAFIFCLYCGLRYCDVKDLTYANIDYSAKRLKFDQNKTKGHSAASGVIVPLSDGIIALVGEPGEGKDRNNLIFNLPSYEMCVKSVSRWVKSAGIDKHITWHCARHSFAVNILNNGANIKTVASLLGHSGLKHTEKYTRACDNLKTDAINSLKPFDIKNI